MTWWPSDREDGDWWPSSLNQYRACTTIVRNARAAAVFQCSERGQRCAAREDLWDLRRRVRLLCRRMLV